MKKLVIQNEEEYYLVYDDILQDSIDIFNNDIEGKEKLLSYIKYLIENN